MTLRTSPARVRHSLHTAIRHGRLVRPQAQLDCLFQREPSLPLPVAGDLRCAVSQKAS